MTESGSDKLKTLVEELALANKEIDFQNLEKSKRAAELVVANKELDFQNLEKSKRATELVMANKELAFQTLERDKRAAELVVANKELAFQTLERDKRAVELEVLNKQLALRNQEMERHAVELALAKKQLALQNLDMERHAAELVVANKELAFQNLEKEKRAAELLVLNEELHVALLNTVRVAMVLSEMRDPYTAGHERRVAEIAVAISVELGFNSHRQEGIRVAGYLHDVGKIGIPAEILAKPGKLTHAQFNLVKEHAHAGYEVLSRVRFPWPIAEVALQHHERMDGSGYPQKLKGENIIIEARIMAVADVVEAMASHRPYRPGLGIEKALAEIECGRTTLYDSEVADACLKIFRMDGFTIPE